MDPTNNVAAIAATLAAVAAALLTNAPALRPMPPIPPSARVLALPQLATLKLSVSYPEPLSQDIVLKIYSTTNIITPDWQILTNLMNGRTSCIVYVYPAQRFYVSTSYSLYWDQESAFSPTSQTPPGPRSDTTLTISRP